MNESYSSDCVIPVTLARIPVRQPQIGRISRQKASWSPSHLCRLAHR